MAAVQRDRRIGGGTSFVPRSRRSSSPSRFRGSDLVTPRPKFGFPGLKLGHRWCLCVARWKEALAAGVAPPVVLAATHEAAVGVVELSELKRHAHDLS